MSKSPWVKMAVVALLVVGGVALAAGSSQAHGYRGGHFYGSLVVGLGPWWSPFWGPWYPRPYYAAPRVVMEQPPVYIQQEPPASPEAAPWFYCPSAKAYYPYVQSCSEPWVRVPATSR